MADSGLGRLRAADRLRQRGQPAAGARHGSLQRDRGAGRARRQPPARHQAVADRKPVASAGRRIVGTASVAIDSLQDVLELTQNTEILTTGTCADGGAYGVACDKTKTITTNNLYLYAEEAPAGVTTSNVFTGNFEDAGNEDNVKLESLRRGEGKWDY